jgi:glycerophosphoryl diester phosphodiesterase
MAPHWLDRRVLHYAHQGGAKEAPSSTIQAFKRAVDLGADGLEMDVHMTADGYLVVAHDETIDRTSRASGRIDCLTLADLRQLDFAHWWAPGHDAIVGLDDKEYPLRGRAPDDSTLGIALLTDVLQQFPDTLINLDIKGGKRPYETELAAVLREYDRATSVIVASFHDAHLQRFRESAPEVPTSSTANESFAIADALFTGAHIDLPPSLVALQIPFRFNPDSAPLFGSEFVERAHDRGLAVHVWTIDDEIDMVDVLETGADGIMTDYPARLESIMAQQAVTRWRQR